MWCNCEDAFGWTGFKFLWWPLLLLNDKCLAQQCMYTPQWHRLKVTPTHVYMTIIVMPWMANTHVCDTVTSHIIVTDTHVYTFMYTCTCTHTHTVTHTHTHTHMSQWSHTDSQEYYTHTHTHIHTCTHTHTHTITHACTHTHTHTCMHTYILTHMTHHIKYTWYTHSCSV